MESSSSLNLIDFLRIYRNGERNEEEIDSEEINETERLDRINMRN